MSWMGTDLGGDRFSGIWNGEAPSWSQDGNLEQFSPYPSRELWNSLQGSPGFNNIGPPYAHGKFLILFLAKHSNISSSTALKARYIFSGLYGTHG